MNTFDVIQASTKEVTNGFDNHNQDDFDLRNKAKRMEH